MPHACGIEYLVGVEDRGKKVKSSSSSLASSALETEQRKPKKGGGESQGPIPRLLRVTVASDKVPVFL